MLLAMLTRRAFLHSVFMTLAAFSVPVPVLPAAQQSSFQGEDVFKRILSKAAAGKWSTLPIGDAMGKIARELQGTPYTAGTLDTSPDHEMCSVNMHGLDCVTFFETTLDFARMLKHGGHTPADLLAEVSYTRYRDGKPGDYSTRLHYTSDWLLDNEKKRVVKILNDLPGAQRLNLNVSFMSTHPQLYVQLAGNPELVRKIKHQEQLINKQTLNYVPLSKIAAVEPLLQTGDIVGLCTSVAGLDIAHTGLIIRSADGVAHFMDASSRKSAMKVTLEPGPISETLSHARDIIGLTFARPLDPNSGSNRTHS